MSFSVGDELEITIDRLSYDGGRGVGRVDGFVFFVPETAPEERVLIQVTNIKKNFGDGHLIKILKPSPARRTPPCPVANQCGGCVWQHITYSEQLNQKLQILTHQLKNILPSGFKIPPVIASPSEFRYRNRVQVHLKSTTFGFFAKGTNNVVAINDCLISDERLFADLTKDNDFIGAAKQANHLKPQKKNSQESDTAKIELAISPTGERIIRPLARFESEFTQVNTQLNLILKEQVVALLKQQGIFKNIYDLYCGSGNISFPIIDAFQDSKFTGVELNARAIERAQGTLAAKYPSRKDVVFVSSAVHKFLKRLKVLAPSSAILLDPPRAGLENGVIEQLQRLHPEVIIYISCALPTLARDLNKFQNYSVSSVQGLDMFPQTEYLETIVSLTRNK